MSQDVACKKCGQVIPAERVEAIPGVQYCAPCQSGAEKAPNLPANYSGEYCPFCSKKGIESPLVWKHPQDVAVRGEFLACSRYPSCHYIDQKSLGNLDDTSHARASPQQVSYLIKLGVPESEAKSLTEGEASRQIDKILSSRRRKPVN